MWASIQENLRLKLEVISLTPMCKKLSIVDDYKVYHFQISCLQPALFWEKFCQDAKKVSLSLKFIITVSLYLTIETEGDQLPVYLQWWAGSK